MDRDADVIKALAGFGDPSFTYRHFGKPIPTTRESEVIPPPNVTESVATPPEDATPPTDLSLMKLEAALTASDAPHSTPRVAEAVATHRMEEPEVRPAYAAPPATPRVMDWLAAPRVEEPDVRPTSATPPVTPRAMDWFAAPRMEEPDVRPASATPSYTPTTRHETVDPQDGYGVQSSAGRPIQDRFAATDGLRKATSLNYVFHVLAAGRN